MFRSRAIPCLLIKGEGLVKTVKFRQPKYVGDPINAVKLFNDLEVDELMLLDITATPEGREPDFARVRDLASEAFMPISYGGGVRSLAHAKHLCHLGVEKIAVTTAAVDNPSLVSELARELGSSTVIVGMDVKLDWLRRPRVFKQCGMKNTGIDPVAHAREVERLGAGELLINSIDRDGTQSGYDFDLIEKVSRSVSIPVIACGGAGSVDDLVKATQAGASAAAAGSLFVFRGPHRAVLINYPSQEELRMAFQKIP
ncbi:MAG: AglZ/HisF2 family acetamidino modification protein [Prosthecobacter sp.]|uniref:AglZ/HisF2 family acetamidino modification protein n=1 Tax=Prosthecobacter sp. TaxID=1965333 RepID=UPI0038FE73EE